MRLNCDCRQGLDFQDVYIRPKRSALPSRNVLIKREMQFKHSRNTWEGVPIIAANMDHTGTIPMLRALNEFNCMTALNKYNTDLPEIKQVIADGRHYNMWYSIGMGPESLEHLKLFTGIARTVNDKFIPNICIDVANGYTEKFVQFVAEVREAFPLATIMAGNVASYEMTEQLIISGADIVKIGIGPGSVCTTRKMTGVGAPQLSAIDECSDAAHGLGGMICADGGCTVPGDVAKAFCAGADFVMLGGMLAGHDECDGEYVYSDGSVLEEKTKNEEEFSGRREDFTKFLQGREDPVGMTFHGMSSRAAQEKYYGGVREYRAAEGKEVVVPYRGSVSDTMKEILGGIRSTMTYIGAQRLKDMPKCATFERTNRQLNEVFS